MLSYISYKSIFKDLNKESNTREVKQKIEFFPLPNLHSRVQMVENIIIF